MRPLFAVLRALMAVAIVAAVIGQLLTSLDFWTARGDQNIAGDVVNFLSFFTIQSNVFAAVVLAIGAVTLLRGSTDAPWFATLRAAATTYMVTTGVVYNLLLRGIELPQGSTLAWSNEVLHLVAPVFLLLDWLLAPGRRPLPVRKVGVIVIYPIVWVVYTLVRGPLLLDEGTGAAFWYPYPFLNPNLSENGYLSVAFYTVLIALVICAVAVGVLWVSRRWAADASARAEARARA
jgi:hypothetical protein